MKKSKWGRFFALATAFVMVFAAVSMLNPTQVQASTAAEVNRIELTEGWGSARVQPGLTPGVDYVMSFYLFNATEGNDILLVEWNHEPWGRTVGMGGDGFASPYGEWVFHEVNVRGHASDVNLQINSLYGVRAPGTVYYISDVTFTPVDGGDAIVVAIGSGMYGNGAIADRAPNPVAPPAAAAPATPIPPTGDFASSLWLIISGIGLVAALASLGVVVHKKRK